MIFDQSLESERIREFLEACPDKPCMCGAPNTGVWVWAKSPDKYIVHFTARHELGALAKAMAIEPVSEYRCAPACSACNEAFLRSHFGRLGEHIETTVRIRRDGLETRLTPEQKAEADRIWAEIRERLRR